MEPLSYCVSIQQSSIFNKIKNQTAAVPEPVWWGSSLQTYSWHLSILLTTIILNTCETEPTASRCILCLLLWFSSGTTCGGRCWYAPLSACSVVCLKGRGHFTAVGLIFLPCTLLCFYWGLRQKVSSPSCIFVATVYPFIVFNVIVKHLLFALVVVFNI